MKATKFTNAKGEVRIQIDFAKDEFGNPTKAPFTCSIDELADEDDLLDTIKFDTGLKGEKGIEVLNLIKSIVYPDIKDSEEN